MADDDPSRIECKECGPRTKWSDLAVSVHLWFPNDDWPHILRIPREPICRVCLGCLALLELFDRVAERMPDPQPFKWQIGRATFRDGYSLIARNPNAQNVVQA
jgi:hypothetical protein